MAEFKRATTDHVDYELKDNSRGDDGPTTVGEVFQEMMDAEKGLSSIRGRAVRNERFVYGEQFRDWNDDLQAFQDIYTPQDIPNVHRNLLRSLWATYNARLLEDRPDVHAWPTHADPGDVGAAKVANALMSHMHSVQDLDDLMWELIGHAQFAGQAAIKVVWDPTAGPLSEGAPVQDPETGEITLEGAGEPTGEVQWEVATVFDFVSDNSVQHIEDANWCYFRRYLTKHQAKILMMEQGIDEEPQEVSIEVWDDGSMESVSAVEMIEVWYRPSARFPEGLYAVIVSGNVVEVMDFPYDHGELPVSVMKLSERRGTPNAGRTHLDDAVVIQRQINELVSSKARLVRECGAVRLMGPDSVIDNLEEGNHTIKIADPGQASMVKWIEPPAVPSLLSEELQDLIGALYAVFGLNEMLTGAANIKSGTAARTIAYLNKLDSQKISGAARSLGKALRRGWRQTLALSQQYIHEPRLMQIAGPGKVFETMSFQGADIGGVDVRLEPSSGIERYRAEEVGDIEQSAQAGWIDPARAGELRETGLEETAAETMDSQRVQGQVIQALQGQLTPPMQNVSPVAAIEELQVAIASVAEERPDIVPYLEQLLMAYQQMLAQAQAPVEQAQPQPTEQQPFEEPPMGSGVQ